RLREAEDVVDEEQRVGAGFVAEPFGQRQTGECGAKTCARRFVHLAEHHRSLVENAKFLAGLGVLELRLLHFEPEVVAFASSFADAAEDREAAVLTGDSGDEFLKDDGLAETSTAEQPGLAAADEWD